MSIRPQKPFGALSCKVAGQNFVSRNILLQRFSICNNRKGYTVSTKQLVASILATSFCVLNRLVGTLRSETRRLQDAAGSKFSKRRQSAHAHFVVLMASGRIENVGLAILTFCAKREYIPSNASVK